MTEPAPVDYSKYDGQKVVLVVTDPNDKEGSLELHGKITTGTVVGVMFQPKGRGNAELFTADQILACELDPDDGNVKPRYLKPIVLGANKTHLADRHGFLLPVVNEMTEEEAADVHQQQHDQNEGLGHIHGERPKSRRDAALEKAADEGPVGGDDNVIEDPDQLPLDDVVDDNEEEDEETF